MRSDFTFERADKEVHDKLEYELVCPKCGEMIDSLFHGIKDNLKPVYICENCNEHIYTLIHNKEVFFMKENNKGEII